MINRNFFLDHAKMTLFGGKLSSAQSKGLLAILDAWEASHKDWDDRWLAYALGTTHLETGAKMAPINELGGRAYFERNYGPAGRNPTRAKKMGNTVPGDGDRYHGRGYVQLTWKVNYKAMSDHLTKVLKKTIDLVAKPELALQEDYAAEIMFFGMNTGAFTGRKFADYFTKGKKGEVLKDNWTGARSIINGNDKAALIAEYGRKYYASISYL